MTAATATAGTFDRGESRLLRILAGPAEGWLTLAGVALMVVALAWSIDDAQWIRGVGRLTDFLAPVGLAGVAVGFLGPKLGWGRWTTHLLGVAFAAMVIPIVGGGVVLGDDVTGWGPAALAARYRESAEILTRVWIDLAIRNLPLTSEYGHYFIGFGALVWATGQHAAYAVFGHRRALDAVIVAGLVLLANMAITQNDQLHLMVLFTLSALVLLARSHAFDERVTWVRRRIGDPAAVTALYLRGGAVFIGGAIVGALLLTGSASSAPLQGLWRGAPSAFVEVSQWLQRYLPLGGASRNPGFVAFGETTAIVGVWSSNNDVAFRARFASTETARFYWQVGAYSDFERTAWSWGTTDAFELGPGEVLLAGTADDPAAVPGRREVTIQVTPVTFTSDLVAGPQTIRSINRDATVRVTKPGRFEATVEVEGGDPYTVTALVPVYGSDPGAINQNRLRVASREYSTEVRRRYLAVPPGTIGPVARALLDEVLARTPATNPYDIARTMEIYLRDGRNFRYDANVQDEAQDACENLSTVECFARIRAGYCQYYASTMAILLREAGIPTRLAQGFLPGDRAGDGSEVVRNAGAHAWVQVLFPGYGWVDFDPTGGGLAVLVPPPSGAPESPTPRPSFGPQTPRPDEADDLAPRQSGSVVAPAGPTASGPLSGPFIAIGVLLLIGVLALASVAWRRGPRTIHPDRAWGSLGHWAARFGFGPRPSQTIYEYAGALGDAVPGMRPELSTVARAKVEIAYGRQVLGPDRLRAVAEAHRRLRLGLLRLAFRRRRPR